MSFGNLMDSSKRRTVVHHKQEAKKKREAETDQSFELTCLVLLKAVKNMSSVVVVCELQIQKISVAGKLPEKYKVL